MIQIKIKKQNLLLSLTLLCFYIVLTYLYIDTIHPIFDYKGFHLNITPLKILESISILLLFIVPIILYLYKNSLFFFMIYLFTITQLIPDLVLYSLTNLPRLPLYCSLTPLLIALIIKNKKFKFPVVKINNKKCLLYITIISIILAIPIITLFGTTTNWNLFLLQEIYSQRDILKSNSNLYTGYMLNWLTLILFPIILLTSLKQKKYVFASLSILFILYAFSISGAKGYLFSLIVLLFFYIKKKSFLHQLLITTILLIFFLLIGNWVDHYYDYYIINALFTNRTLFLPSLIKQFYFDFFQQNPIYLSHSIFKSIQPYPYTESPTYLIGGTFMNNFKQNTNTGFIGDAYMNFGILGTIIYSFIVCFLFKYFESLNIAPRYSGIFFMLILNFQNGSLTTAILTNGLLLLIILSFLLLRNTNYKVKNNI